MSKYIEVESLKKDIKKALKDKSEFMADAVCNVIDRREATEAMQSNEICDYCGNGIMGREHICGGCDNYCYFVGKKVIEVVNG